MLEIKLIKKTYHGYYAEYSHGGVNSIIDIPLRYLLQFINKSIDASAEKLEAILNANSDKIVTDYIKTQLPVKKPLNFLELSDMCDTCLLKEREALNAENMQDAEFYSKVWAIIIAEMAKCEVAPSQLINV